MFPPSSRRKTFHRNGFLDQEEHSLCVQEGNLPLGREKILFLTKKAIISFDQEGDLLEHEAIVFLNDALLDPEGAFP